MQVDISLSLVELDKEVKIYIQRKLEIALSRTALYITAISIVLSKKRSSESENENDIHCILTLSIIDSPEVVIEDTQSNLYYVIDRAIQKAKRTMDRIVAQQF